MRYIFTLFISLLFTNCSDSSSPNNYMLTVDNDLPVQVKFYVDDDIKLRIDGYSLDEIELQEGSHKFAISSPSFNDCNPYFPYTCMPVFSTLTSDLDTVISFNRDMTATIQINLIERLRNDIDFYHVELRLK